MAKFNIEQRQARKYGLGVSLIELCVCLVVTAILVSQAVPAMEQLKQGQRLDLIAQTVMTDLQQARSEAVQRA
ncbi:pilus assembly FimT family protein, partial [Roseateles sp. GG27B]